jgi:hypothetical protein
VSGRRPDTGDHGGSKRTFNWLILLKFFAGWVATLVVAGLTAAGELLPQAQCPTSATDRLLFAVLRKQPVLAGAAPAHNPT